MDDKVQFYYNPMSRSRIAHWMLEEVGAPYEVHLLDFQKKEHKDPKFLALNPMGKLPTIVHRGVVVTESAAICTYLADAFFDKGLAPSLSDPKRGTYLRWLFFGAGCVEPAILDRAYPRIQTDKASSIGYGTYEDTINTLEKALTPGPFILGNQFSAADVYLASQIGWAIMTKGIDPRPTFQKYLAHCGERPGYKRFEKKTAEFMEKVKPSPSPSV